MLLFKMHGDVSDYCLKCFFLFGCHSMREITAWYGDKKKENNMSEKPKAQQVNSIWKVNFRSWLQDKSLFSLRLGYTKAREVGTKVVRYAGE